MAQFITILVLSLALVACGNGGNGNDGAVTPPTLVPATPTPNPNPPAPNPNPPAPDPNPPAPNPNPPAPNPNPPAPNPNPPAPNPNPPAPDPEPPAPDPEPPAPDPEPPAPDPGVNAPAPGAGDGISYTIQQGVFYLYLNDPVDQVVGRLLLVPPADGATWTISSGNDHGIFGIDNLGTLSILSEPEPFTANLQANIELGIEVRFGNVLVNGQVRVKTAVQLVDLQLYEYRLTNLRANEAFVIESEQLNCPTGEFCCALSVDAREGYLDFNAIVARAPDYETLRFFYPPLPASPELVLKLLPIRGKICRATLPDIVASAEGSSIEETISARGELAQHDDVSVSRIGGRDYLLDVSRRGNGLSDDAVIYVQNDIYKQPSSSNSLDNPRDLAYFSTFHDAPVDALPSGGDQFLRPGVDAHKNTLIVFDYIKDVLGYDSYDTNGASMIVLTTVTSSVTPIPCPQRDSDSIPNRYTASWNGSFVTIRNLRGRCRPTVSLGAALDVIGHEWGHALVSGLMGSRGDGIGGLEYEREPGALSEAFSDWLGIAIEEAGSETIDWRLGGGAIAVIRHLDDPMASTGAAGIPHPDTYMEEPFWIQTTSPPGVPGPVCSMRNDYCGIHSNNGVGNKMFSLLASGGTHNGVSVVGIGIEKAIKIATKAVEIYWTKNTGYVLARMYMIMAAGTEHGEESNEQIQTRRAWDAVQVPSN